MPACGFSGSLQLAQSASVDEGVILGPQLVVTEDEGWVRSEAWVGAVVHTREAPHFTRKKLLSTSDCKKDTPGMLFVSSSPERANGLRCRLRVCAFQLDFRRSCLWWSSRN